MVDLVLARVLSHQQNFLPDILKAQFEIKNKGLKLFYNPGVYLKIKDLSNTVYQTLAIKKSWNGSVLNLYDDIMAVTAPEIQSTYLANLNQYVNESTVNSDSSHTLMSVIWYTIL